jgi:hypothetical protein
VIFYILRVARFLKTNMGVANQKSLGTPDLFLAGKEKSRIFLQSFEN